VETLRQQPYEHRVAIVPTHFPANEKVLTQLYQVEWLQQQFPFYNVQAFDIADLPRVPEDLAAFQKIYQHPDTNRIYYLLSRAWELCNTRYILAPANFESYWNRTDYLAQNQIQFATRFDIVPKPGVTQVTKVYQLTAALASQGRFALFELTNALPRAKLYTQWQVETNNTATLDKLFSPEFDPQRTVLVDRPLPIDSATNTNDSPAGDVEFVDYAPKHLTLKAEATAPSVLLLNDHFDPNWKVLVDGAPAQLLRCNSLMRGVQLTAGTHVAEFRFQPAFRLLYVSLAAIASALLVLGMLFVSERKALPSVPADQSQPMPPNGQKTPRSKAEIRKKTTAARSFKT
jgi:hypothetical protein